MKSHLIILAAASALVAGGVDARPGTATKYRPAYIFGGYSEKQIEPGVWKVTGRSNGIAEVGFGRNMAVYRAAEILAAQGFTYVQVLDSKGKMSMIGLSRNSMSPAGENMTLVVRGANAPGQPTDCRAKELTACGTLPIAATMTRLRPLLYITE